MKRRALLLILLASLAAYSLLTDRFSGTDRSTVDARARVPETVWSSPEACVRLLEKGRRPRQHDVVRVVTWNLRWFPDGAPTPGGRHGTDVSWLACTLAWLDADVVATQEVKANAASAAALDTLLQEASRLTDASWKVRLDGCPKDGRPHLALLWNDSRVEVRDVHDVAALNPIGEACAGRLRPGLAGRVVSRGRGLDLSVVVVHSDSGKTARDERHRAETIRALPAAVATLARGAQDADVLVLGDFNPMGSDDPPVTPAAELEAQDAALLGASPAMRRLGPRGPSCSEYYRKRPALLDAIYATAEMEEAAGAAVEVDGFCRTLACERMRGKAPEAYERLSDHCPLVVDLPDRDRDSGPRAGDAG